MLPAGFILAVRATEIEISDILYHIYTRTNTDDGTHTHTDTHSHTHTHTHNHTVSPLSVCTTVRQEMTAGLLADPRSDVIRAARKRP